MTEIVVAISSCIGARLAGLAGAALAIRRYRSERAFDAQVEWHRDLARTAKVLKNRSLAFRYWLVHQGAPKGVLPDLDELGSLMFSFQELAEQAPLYARVDTCEAIEEVVRLLNGLDFENAPDPTPELDEEDPHPLDLSIGALGCAFEMLARDHRKLLGLKALPRHAMLDDDPSEDEYVEDELSD